MNDPPDPLGLVGTILARTYRVEAVVAEGGSAIVYRGHHTAIEKAIAIKVLRSIEGDDRAGALTRFLVEAKTLARLKSPGTVKVYDAGTIDERPWIALEWIDGETLDGDLARRRSEGKKGRSRAETLALLAPVFASIAEAHDAGIAHRDLKPKNVMLATNGGARVVDFGIAKMMEGESHASTGLTATAAQTRAFSLAYAAPEQLSGARTGPWTDVHALGLMLTELLTDEPPYGKADAEEIYRAALDAKRPTPAKHGIDVGAWEAVIARALAIAPNERHPSARELHAELEAKVDASAESPVSPERPTRALLWNAVLIVVVCATAFGFAMAARARGGNAPAVAQVAKCTSAKACTAEMGKPAVCRGDGKCVELGSEDCQVSAEADAIGRDDTIWIGTLFPIAGPQAAEYGFGNTQATELARRELEAARAGGVKMRPLGLIACDDAVDAKRAATHLVDVGVPAVVGFRSGAEAIEVTTSTLIPRGVLSMCATSGNPLVTRVPQPDGVPRLVWRTTYSIAGAVSAIGMLMSDYLEPLLRSGGNALGADGTIRVALVRPMDASGASLSKTAFETIRFNGKTALANGSAFRELTYSLGPELSAADAARIERDLESFAPHVILHVGDGAIIDHVFRSFEARVAAGTPRPFYATFDHFTPSVLDFVSGSAGLRHRTFALTTRSSTPENSRMVARYNAAFSRYQTTETVSPNSAYDAVYFLAYAAEVSGGPVSGAALAEGIARLVPPGLAEDVGPTSIADVTRALSRGERVDVNGATGALDFDPTTGEAAFDQVILCAGIDATGRPNEGIESGLVVRASTGRLEGQLRCP